MPRSQQPRKSTFVNPLLQASTQAAAETPLEPAIQRDTEKDTHMNVQPDTPTETYTQFPHRKRGRQRFEVTHERWSTWIDKRLKKAFLKLVKEEEVSQVELLNEAIADLLKKRGKLP